MYECFPCMCMCVTRVYPQKSEGGLSRHILRCHLDSRWSSQCSPILTMSVFQGGDQRLLAHMKMVSNTVAGCWAATGLAESIFLNGTNGSNNGHTVFNGLPCGRRYHGYDCSSVQDNSSWFGDQHLLWPWVPEGWSKLSLLTFSLSLSPKW